MKHNMRIKDDITGKDHAVIVSLQDAFGVHVTLADSPCLQNVAVEVHDGKLKVHVWAGASDAPDSINVPIEDVMSEDCEEPRFQHFSNDDPKELT